MEIGAYTTLANAIISIMVASCVIILITNGNNSSNGLSALIGGYCGIMFSLIMIIVINMPLKNSSHFSSIMSCAVAVSIIFVTVIYLYKYFDRIINGEVAPYYNTFYNCSLVLLSIQVGYIMYIFYNTKQLGFLNLTPSSRAFMVFVAILNYMFVITNGAIVLRLYSTQG
jgi:hypothetical protein